MNTRIAVWWVKRDARLAEVSQLGAAVILAAIPDK
jgi:hypothetical protein